MVFKKLLKVIDEPQLWHLKFISAFTEYKYPLVFDLFFLESPQIGQRKLYKFDFTLLNFSSLEDISPINFESI
jgi:hypothetical protein